MKLVFLAEFRRFVRDRTNFWLLTGLGCVLLVSAVSSGLAARAWRAGHDTAQAEWNTRKAQTEALARKMPAGEQSMMATFRFARSASPPAVLPPLGGLALAPGAFALLAPDARVTVESRHTDHRRGESIANPLLGGLGVPDLAATLALLVPLAILGACAGLLQQLREAGLWRMVAAQGPRTGGVLAAALAVRGGAIFGVAMAASAFAFALDPGATLTALGAWTLVMLAYCTLWTGVAALACSLPLSSGAAMLVAMGAWAATTFCIPALIEAGMDRHAPFPSRLAAVARVRSIQQDAEVRSPELLARWYADHPGDLPAGRSSHTWPVSFLPRFLEQERNVRPIMAAFDDARAARFTIAGRWSIASPSLALAMVADELAGIDPARFSRHMDSVNAYEDAWRAFFIPPVMRYTGLRAEEFGHVPVFAAAPEASWPRVGAARLSLFGLAVAAALAAVAALRRRVRQA